MPLLAQLHEAEVNRYRLRHTRCLALGERSSHHFLYGVPLHWMNDWPMPSPLFVRAASGATFTCADDLWHDDFCLGDTGAMFGHSPPAVSRAVAQQAEKGLTAMLPSEDAAIVGELLAERFGLPYWQLATSASDANRFALRWARAVTGRSQVLVFNGCYHGTVDDVLVDLVDGRPRMRDSLLGQVQDLTPTTRVVEFNDLAGLAAALSDRQVACVLTEPALTNIGMVLPDAGFLAGVRELTRRTGTLLILDETHTLSVGPGGATREWGLEPDIFVLGKAVAGGLPCAVYGFTAEVAERMRRAKDEAPPGHSGIGTTLTGNPMSLAALRANIESMLNSETYAPMHTKATQLADGLRAVIAARRLPWSVTQLGARAEFQFCARLPRNGSEAALAFNAPLERYIHLYLINRGIMITPFHNMTLVCPQTEEAAIARLHEAFAECLDTLLAANCIAPDGLPA